MDEDLKVSYVLAAHNGERFVAESIKSILTQTHQNLELIVVLDGPTDNTPEIVRSFDDPRLIVLEQLNLGMSFAWNRGIPLCSGDIIGIFSHDDVMYPEKTAIQLREMTEKGLDFSFTWAEVIGEDGKPVEDAIQQVFNQSAENSEQLREKLFHGNFLLAPSFLCRSECFQYFVWNNVSFGLQDYALWLQMSQRFEGAVLEIPLVKYRVHDSNVSRSERYVSEYRWLEVWTAKALCVLEEAELSGKERADKNDKADKYLAQAKDLSEEDSPQLLFLAYLLANRSIILAPTQKPGYQLLAKILRSMSFTYPAEFAERIGNNVSPEHEYPVPLIPPLVVHSPNVAGNPKASWFRRFFR